MLQAFCSSITGTLATHAVLKGAGVGDSSATALAATITWMLKGVLDILLPMCVCVCMCAGACLYKAACICYLCSGQWWLYVCGASPVSLCASHVPVMCLCSLLFTLSYCRRGRHDREDPLCMVPRVGHTHHTRACTHTHTHHTQTHAYAYVHARTHCMLLCVMQPLHCTCSGHP